MNQNLRLPIILSIAIILGMFIGINISEPKNTDGKRILNFNFLSSETRINELMNLIRNNYVDTVNTRYLEDEAITVILRKLDPHSNYIPLNRLKAVNETLDGNFDGIGVEFNIIHDTVIVIGVIFGGPSEKVGIQPGDRIVKVNDEIVAGVGIDNETIISKLRGSRGTEVKLEIMRKRSPELLTYNIRRNKIPIFSLDAYYMVNESVGYIKMNRFSATTYQEFIDACKSLKNQGMASLILDLRGNGGGYLNEATSIVDEFLEPNELIVYTQGKNRKKQVYKSTTKKELIDIKLAVLIDENSASASEIVAGAIQDHDRGIIVGRRSFGKGLVQEQLQLSDGSALRLTVARYFTPSGRCIQKPYTDDVDAYYTKNNLELFFHPDTLKKMLDSLYSKENEERFFTKSGRIVQGGGGVVPDFFVAYDTTGFTPYLRKVNNTGIIYDFAFSFTDNNREFFHKFSNYKEYDKDKALKDRVFREFIVYAEKQGIRRNENEIKKSESIIRHRLKAFIARNVWGNEAYYYYLNTKDAIFEKAVVELTK